MKSLFVPVGQGKKREAITNCNTGWLQLVERHWEIVCVQTNVCTRSMNFSDLSFEGILQISWQMEFKVSASKVALCYLTDSESNIAIIYLFRELLMPCSRTNCKDPVNVDMA